ncbi:MAG: hypothetical protein IJ324_09310 [Lachnospiraceae bacterium]|nr:hypothetical protein [Lachnospiraceae bacterium]
MVFLGCLILVFWLGILPVFVGSIFSGKNSEYSNSVVFRFMSGTMLLWAVFQLLCVPCVIRQESFGLVVIGYLTVSAVLFLCGMLSFKKYPLRFGEKRAMDVAEKRGWIGFCVLLVMQLVCAVVLAYADGDDAFYVAVSEITNDSNTMYQKSPYSTGVTELDIRHGLAPFPIWITFLARISGFHTATVSHVIIAAYLIALSYLVFYLVGTQLFTKKSAMIPIFLDIVAFLVLFGDYSSRTPENFMIARSRQGKAAIGSIIIPMLLFLLLIILRQIQEGKKNSAVIWLLLTATTTAACLCTTLGTFLSCAMVGCVGICVLLVYKKIVPVIKMALCCAPAAVFALLYFVLG